VDEGFTRSSLSLHPFNERAQYELERNATYTSIHAFDGYSSDDIGKLAKDKPQLRSDYSKSMETRARLEEKIGRKRVVGSFKDLV
jgi:wobble nucleotide-excising tRNase